MTRARRREAALHAHCIEPLERRALFSGLPSGIDSLAIDNQVPAAVAGAAGGYTLSATDASIRFDAGASSDPDGDPLVFTWDLNADGVFGDASGESPELAWAQLQLLNVKPNGTTDVRVRVDDGRGGVVDSPAVPLVVARPASRPILAHIAPSGPSGVAMASADGAAFEFWVSYYSGRPLDVQSIAGQDVRVTAPNGSVVWAEVVRSVELEAREGYTKNSGVLYRFAAPGGTADVADAGTYTVQVMAGAVTDLGGDTVPATAGPVRTATEVTPPTFALHAPPPALDNYYDFTVVYADDTGLDPASLDVTPLTVTRLRTPRDVPSWPQDEDVRLARSVSKAQNADGSWTVSYRLALTETPWRGIFTDATYVFTQPEVWAQTVKDVWGNPVMRLAEVGRIDVSLPKDGPDVRIRDLVVDTSRSGLPGTAVKVTMTLDHARQYLTDVRPPLPAPIEVRLLLSRDELPDPTDVTVASLTGVRLGSKPRKLRFNLIARDPGNYRLIAVADAGGVLVEPNEFDNHPSAFFGVAEPTVGLDVRLKVPAKVRRGAVAPLVLELINEGNIPARGSVRVSVDMGFGELGAKTFRVNLKPSNRPRPRGMRVRLPVRVPSDQRTGFGIFFLTVEPDIAGSVQPVSWPQAETTVV